MSKTNHLIGAAGLAAVVGLVAACGGSGFPQGTGGAGGEGGAGGSAPVCETVDGDANVCLGGLNSANCQPGTAIGLDCPNGTSLSASVTPEGVAVFNCVDGNDAIVAGALEVTVPPTTHVSNAIVSCHQGELNALTDDGTADGKDVTPMPGAPTSVAGGKHTLVTCKQCM